MIYDGITSKSRTATESRVVIAGLLALLLILSISISLLATPAQAHGPDGYVWMESTGNPVFTGINRAYYPRVIKVGATYHMWYTDVTATSAYQVGYATSADGLAWSAPAVVTGLTGQPAHTVVVNIGTDASPRYRIWYEDGATAPAGSTCLRTAVSDNGTGWTSDAAIGEDPSAGLLRTDNTSDPAYKWRYGTYGPGAVLYNPGGYSSLNKIDPMGNKYVMYYDQYTRYEFTGIQEATMLAISADGINWSRYGNDPVVNASGGSSVWDAQYVYAWSVIKDATGYHLWYSGGIGASSAGIGYAYSADGLNWTKDPNAIFSYNEVGVPAWRNTRTYTPCVLQEGSIYKMWYSGVGSSRYRVGFAAAGQPGGAPTDPTGAVKRIFFRKDSVYCSGRFFAPGSNVDVYIVADDSWSNNQPIPTDLSSDGVNTVPIDAAGNLALTMVWPGRLTVGKYDIVFDTNRDGRYESGVDVIDNPNDPGFEVFDDPGSAPVFPNIYVGIAAALGAGIVAYAVRRRLAAR